MISPYLCEDQAAKDWKAAVLKGIENETVVVVVDRPVLQLHQVVDQLPAQIGSQGRNLHSWVVFPSPAAAAVLRDGHNELAVGRELSREPAELRIELVNSVKEEVDGVLGGGLAQQLLEIDEERRLLRGDTVRRHVEVVRELKAYGTQELNDRVAVWG